MLNKLIKDGVIIGISISLLGYIILNLFSLAEEFSNIIETIYHITTVLGVLYTLTVSKFINHQFAKIFKAISIILLIIFGINLLNEINILNIEPVETILLFLISGLYFIYLNYFRKKVVKIPLDYLKIIVLTLLFFSMFLNYYNIYPSSLQDIGQICFWIVLAGMLLNEYTQSKITYTK